MTKKIQLNFAIFVLAFIILGSILAPLLATHNPFEPDMANRLQSPCWQHFFGTDAELWINLQSRFELYMAERKAGRAIKSLPTLKDQNSHNAS